MEKTIRTIRKSRREEIRLRAERRLGEMLMAQKETVGLAHGGHTQRTRFRKGTESPPTLAEAGVDKKLSSHAQKIAATEAAPDSAGVGDLTVLSAG